MVGCYVFGGRADVLLRRGTITTDGSEGEMPAVQISLSAAVLVVARLLYIISLS